MGFQGTYCEARETTPFSCLRCLYLWEEVAQLDLLGLRQKPNLCFHNSKRRGFFTGATLLFYQFPLVVVFPTLILIYYWATLRTYVIELRKLDPYPLALLKKTSALNVLPLFNLEIFPHISNCNKFSCEKNSITNAHMTQATSHPSSPRSLLQERDWALFRDEVFKRARLLIKTHIWEGIEEHRLDNWIDAFETYSTPVLAALLLDSLIYRSDAQFESLLRATFNDDNLRAKLQIKDSLTTLLSSNLDSQIRIAPVIGLDSPPTKSGPYVLRIA